VGHGALSACRVVSNVAVDVSVRVRGARMPGAAVRVAKSPAPRICMHAHPPMQARSGLQSLRNEAQPRVIGVGGAQGCPGADMGVVVATARRSHKSQSEPAGRSAGACRRRIHSRRRTRGVKSAWRPAAVLRCKTLSAPLVHPRWAHQRPQF
jgi:hypothetical protein